jgi:ketosteroid isomerase-like protein
MSSSQHDHVALLRRYFDAYEQGDPALLDGVLAPGYHQFNGGTREDEATVRQSVTQFGGNQVSISYTIDEAISQGDTIVSRVTFHYTDVATGRQSTYTSLFWGVTADGKLSHGWGMHETVKSWQQLGILPTGEAFRDWLRERRALAAAEATSAAPEEHHS